MRRPVKPARRPGRPPLDPSGASVPVHVKLSPSQYDATYLRAQRAGVSVPEILRRDAQRAEFRNPK
jgi:hypothetical protein